jgi:hypothetical protein
MSGIVRLIQTEVGREKLAGYVQRVRESGGNFYGKSPSTGLYRKGLTEALWEGPARILAAPVRGLRGAAGGLLYGRKQMFGPMAGKRLQPVKGAKGLVPISKKQYDAVKAGLVKGDVIKVKSGPFSRAYFKRAYERGGLVGFAKKKPLIAGGLGLGALLLAGRPDMRGLAAGMIPEMPANEVSPDVESTFSEPVSQGSALNKSTWG